MLLLSIFLDQKVKKNQNKIKEPSFRTPRGLLLCVLNPQPPNDANWHFSGLLQFEPFQATSCYLQQKRLSSLKSALNFLSSKRIFLPSKCTSQLLHRKPLKRNCLHFFKTFKKQCALESLMKVNLLLEMLLLLIFLDQKVKKNQNLIKEPSLGTPRGLLPCLLSLSLGMTPIGVFSDYFSLSNFLASSCCLQRKRLSSLNFALNLASISLIFCHLSILVWCCAANQ